MVDRLEELRDRAYNGEEVDEVSEWAANEIETLRDLLDEANRMLERHARMADEMRRKLGDN